jgi:predicted permease
MAEATATMDVLHHGIVADVEAATLSSLPASRLEQFLAQRLIIEPGSRGQSELRGTATPPLTILLVITTLVLLIVCVNIANLLLARGLSRANEMAVRASVGATRGRLVGQLLTESAVLALAGGVLSIPVAIITLRSISALLPDQLASGLAVNFSGAAALFTGGASLATLLLFGSVPAWQASGTSPGTALRGQASRLTGKRGTASFRRALSTVQIALSMVLLILAGLFTRSLANITRLDLGIRTDYLVTFTIAPRLNNYGAADADVLYDRIETALAGQPGVVTVASAGIPLLADAGMTFFPSVTSFEAAPGDNRSQSNIVSPDFFRALSIPLLAGRDFLDTDFRQPQNGAMFESTVAIVNESFAHKFFGSVNAVGKSFSIPYVADSIEIVGVVGDTKYVGVKRDVDPQFYVPGRQYGDDASLSFYVRGGTEADALLRMIPRVIADIAPAVPVSDLITMEGQIDNNIYLDRLMTVLSESFAALATLLAGIGLYGVLTYDLTQRTRELGLRLALGAQPRDLRVLVLKQVGPMVAIGGAAGVIAAVVAGRVAETLLFGLSRYDPLVLGLSVAALSGVVLVASYVPAKRASTVTPVEALRYE